MATTPLPRRRGVLVVVVILVVALVAAGVALLTREQPHRVDPTWRALGEPGVGGRLTDVSVSPSDSTRVLAAGDVFGIGRSTDGGETWKGATGLAAWEVASFTWHPSRADEVWVGTMSGPYVSTDAGATWSPRRLGMPAVEGDTYSAPIEQVVFDPRDETRLLAFGGSRRGWGGGEGPGWGVVWSSSDSGSTWARIGSVVTDANVVAAGYFGDGRTLLAAVAGQGLRRSTDGGRSWTVVGVDQLARSATDLAFHPTAPGVAWASSDGGSGSAPGGVFRTDDGGLTWRATNNGLTRVSSGDSSVKSRYLVIAASVSAPGVVYTADAGYAADRVFRSDDSGDNWREVLSNTTRPRSPWTSGLHVSVIGLDPSDEDHVLVADDERLLASHDGGAGWTGVDAVADGDGWRGTGWSGLVAMRVTFDADHADTVVLSGWDGANPLMTVGGGVWRRPLVSWDGFNGAYDAAFSGDSVYVLLGQAGRFNGIARSHDRGASWEVAVGGALPARGSRGDLEPGGIVALDDGTVLATVEGTLFVSTDGATTWEALQTGGSLGDLAIDADDPTVVWASGAGGVVRITDAGRKASLESGSPGGPPGATRLTVDPSTDDLYLAVWREGDDAGLWRRREHRWTRIRNDPFVREVAVHPDDPDALVLVTDDDPYHDESDATGVWVSTNGGKSWHRANTGLAVLRLAAVAFDPHRPDRVVIGAAGGGWFVGTFE